MTGRLVVSVAALAVSLATALQAREGNEAPVAASVSGKETSADEAEQDASSPHPIADSVDRAVADAIANDPECQAARAKNVPCFPSSVQVKGETLQKALDRFRDKTAGAGPPGPSASDEERLRHPEQPQLGGISFDPVCVGKSLWKRAKGQKDTFWVYRITDRMGQTVILRDTPLDARQEAQGLPRAYELVGKYEGECAALAAYRDALRTLRWKEEEAAREGP